MKCVFALFIAASAGFSQQRQSASSGLEPAVQSILDAQKAPAWIAYSVPIVAGQHQGCWNNGNTGNGNIGGGTLHLEGPTQLTVLLRAEGQKIGKIRTATPDCELDPGGLPLYWLTDVRPADSVHYLTSLAPLSVTAIALHADASADKALESLSAASQPEALRRKAIFWLGSTRGRSGYEAVSRIALHDSDEKIRAHAIFALTQSKEAEAIPTVIQVAREDKAPHVRKQALFWLGQSKDPRAMNFFEELLSR